MTLALGPISGLSWLYIGYEQFIAKPLVITGYCVLYARLRHRVKNQSELGQAFAMISQFLIVCSLRYVLQDIIASNDFGWHARIYYCLFILLYFPSFLLMITKGISKSVSLQFSNYWHMKNE